MYILFFPGFPSVSYTGSLFSG